MKNKSNAGRKPIYNESMDKNLIIRITRDHMQQLNEISSKNNQSVSEFVRQSIQETLKSKGQ
jgi:predicted DNA-binding protein